MNEQQIGLDKTGAIMCQGDWVKVDAPKNGDKHKTEFKGMVQIIAQHRKSAIIMDMDGDSFWLGWDSLERVEN
mgnify:FL=1